MKKKLIAMLLASGMVLSCLAGCGKEVSNDTETKQSEVATSETKQEETKVSEEKEEVVEVTWVIRNDPQEDDEKVLEAVNEILREKYSLELNLIAIPNAEYKDRMNLMITSGEEWDICYTSNFVNTLKSNVEREAFLALENLLKNSEAGKWLMEVYPEGLTDVATMNGHIYAIPNYQLMYNQVGAYIQKDLADEFGLKADEIKDITDLEPFMEWVRDNKQGIWPLCEGMSYVHACQGVDGYVIYDSISNCGIAIDDETYTVVDPLQDPSWYEARKLLNSYYHKGFIRSDAATAVDITADQAANRYAITIGTAKPGGDAEYTAKYGKEYILVDFGPIYLPYDAGATTMLGINVNSENPEAAIKMIGVMWHDPEVYNMLLFGLEGEHYTKVSENRVELIADSGYNRSGHGWALGNQFNAWLLPGQADDVWEVTEANNASAAKSVLSGFVADTTPVATENTQLKSVSSEFENGWKYVDDFDAWYNDYVAKKKTAGIDTVIAEMQKQVDAWRAANGK